MKKYFYLLISFTYLSNFQAQSNPSQSEKSASFNCYFDYNSALFHKDSLAKMDAWLKPYLSKYAVILDLAAYTDTIGSEARNQLLAERRLKSIYDYLGKNQIGVNKTKVIGETYSKTGYKKDKLYRKVQIMLQLEEIPVPVNKIDDPMSQLIKERMEVFDASAKPITLNIQFVPGQDVYIGDSYLEVAALLNYLKQNPKKKAFIRGHVCCGNNVELSTKRALAVYNDLLLEGIAAERISYNGFGNSMPVVQELDEESRQQNRRVDVVFSDL